MIFLYEPDTATASIMRVIFEELNTHSFIARTEGEALKAVNTWTFSHVFLDCWQNTHETCRAVLLELNRRELDPTKTEIIIMKQSPLAERFHDVIETYRILIKPFKIDTLEFILGKTVQERAESKKYRSSQKANEEAISKNY